MRAGAKLPAPRAWRATKVSETTLIPWACRRAACFSPSARQAWPPISSTGRAAARRARAAASMAEAMGAGRTGFWAITGWAEVSNQAESAGRIRLTGPPGGP
jgi:hypothetical protein